MEEKNKNLIKRAPIVVIMGHIDHGKTSLLMAIKDFGVLEEESGGITQHIGAYEIEYQGKKITFIDTPGHEAFWAMRSHGAKVADIAILVVAVDEGIKEQTKEAIEVIKKEGISLIVAINKIDKPETNTSPQRIERELSKYEIFTESQGGKTPVVKTSAKTKKGVDQLIEMILLVSDLENLFADISKPANGIVIESSLDSKKGPLATLILKEGILKPGDIIGTHSAVGKIKSITNFLNKPIEKVFPSQPVLVTGFEKPPLVGEKFKVFASYEEAVSKIKKEEKTPSVLLVEGNKPVLNLILKSDVLGTLEALKSSLANLPQEKIILRILDSGVGNVDISDVKLAEDAKATIYGFRIKVDSVAKAMLERVKVKVRIFEIIYDLIQELRREMEASLAPKILKKELGKIRILIVFTSGRRQVLGGKVIEGEVERKECEIEREGEIIGRGKIVNLQQNKKDMPRISKGSECGILLESDTRVEKEDILIIYQREKVKEEL